MKLRRTLIIAGAFLLLGNGCTGTVVLKGDGTEEGRDLKPSSHFVTYTAEGEFEPNTYRIPVGETLNIVNESDMPMRPSSEGLFDAGKELGMNELFQFTFKNVGTYRYANAANPHSGGTIVVVNE